MSVQVFHYPRCSTCKKAVRFLTERGVQFELIDLVESPPSQKKLKEVLEKSALPHQKLWNTSGELYRAGGYSAKVPTMGVAEALRELSTQGKLIKRPIVVGPDFALVGFKEDEYRKRF